MDLFWAAFSFSLPKSKSFVITWSFWFKILESIFLYFFKEGLSCTMVIRAAKEWVDISVSWPQLQTGFMQYWKLHLNLWSAKWLNPILILVRNFKPSLLSTLKHLIGFRSNKFSNYSLTLQEAELRILTSSLFHSIITAGKKEFLKKFVFVLKKGIWLFWTLLVV